MGVRGGVCSDAPALFALVRLQAYLAQLFKPAVTVHQCLNGRAPPHLQEHCIPVSSADTRRHLRSANRHLLAVPHFRLNTYGRRAFSVAGPMAWNPLPDLIRDPTSNTDCLRRLLKTYSSCSRVTSASSALGVFNDYALHKSTHSLTHSLILGKIAAGNICH